MTFEPSAARRGLDMLLERHPGFELVAADWQRPPLELYSESVPQRRWVPEIAGPWLLVTLGQRSADGGDAFALYPFAIWKATGAVYGVGHDGAVGDDPILEP